MANKTKMVTAQYQLPKPLAIWVKEQAIKRETFPCRVVETILADARNAASAPRVSEGSGPLVGR